MGVADHQAAAAVRELAEPGLPSLIPWNRDPVVAGGGTHCQGWCLGTGREAGAGKVWERECASTSPRTIPRGNGDEGSE